MRATNSKNPEASGFAAAADRRSLKTTRDLVHPNRERRLRPTPASTSRCASVRFQLRRATPRAEAFPASLSSVKTLHRRPATSRAAQGNSGMLPVEILRCGTCLHRLRRDVSKGGTCPRRESAAHAQKQEAPPAARCTAAPVSEYSKCGPRRE